MMLKSVCSKRVLQNLSIFNHLCINFKKVLYHHNCFGDILSLILGDYDCGDHVHYKNRSLSVQDAAEYVTVSYLKLCLAFINCVN